MSDAISPFGVGAIVDILGDSLIANDITWWPEESPSLICRRLERQLGVGLLKTPPSTASTPSKSSPALKFARFPEWRFCQNCGRMSNRMQRIAGVVKNVCGNCKGPMVPMRFVLVCETGSHVADVPWKYWVHRTAIEEKQSQCESWDLMEFSSSSGGYEGLSSLSVTCRACNARRHFGELSGAGSLAGDGIKCPGRQPWQPRDGEYSCVSPVHAVQRGTASLHIAETLTAIDIPESVPQSVALGDKIRAHSVFSALAALPDGPGAPYFAEIIAKDVGCEISTVINVAGQPAPGMALARAGLLDGEWAAFDMALQGRTEAKASDFVVDRTSFEGGADFSNVDLDGMIAAVGLVRRIREVRAMKGFRRYSSAADLVDVDLQITGSNQKWYPAYEQFGEGIFLKFAEDAVAEWETQESVRGRVLKLEKRRQASNVGSRFVPVTGRSIALHTLSHLLIRRLAFASGYSSASIRERVYADIEGAEPQAGILLYTAAGDVEGTLGGLVRQGESTQLFRTVLRSVEDADSCSNDPVCRESRGQGMDALNLAACHGCTLTAETSCESANLFLDRVLLVGNREVPGLFQTLLGSARAAI